MQDIKHIFFDLDHTLWDFETNSAIAFQNIFEKHQIKIPLQGFLKFYVPINLQYWKNYREEKISKSTLRYGRLKDTFDKLSYEISDKKIAILAIDYLEALPKNNMLFEGTIEILEYLSKKYTLHIITNGFKEVQTLKLKNAKIKHYFNVIIDSEVVGVKKPNPKIFKEALQQAKASSTESVMIGDNMEADILGAINSGMKAIYCNFINAKREKGILQITSLKELQEYL